MPPSQTENPAPKAEHDLTVTADHRYLVGGQQVPGVTRVLTDNRLVDFSGPWFTETARQRGEDLHAFCALVNDGTIDWDGVYPDILPEVEAYAEWKQASGFTPVGVETPLYSKRYRFAGRPDAYGPLGNGHKAVIDLKRGAAVPAVGIQLSGYAVLLEEDGFYFAVLLERYAITKLRGGKARVAAFPNNREDRDTFLAALTLTHWRMK